ncbi:MAG: hypothetical protein AAB463_02220 [Patescibacteria group bacterium]
MKRFFIPMLLLLVLVTPTYAAQDVAQDPGQLARIRIRINRVVSWLFGVQLETSSGFASEEGGLSCSPKTQTVFAEIPTLFMAQDGASPYTWRIGDRVAQGEGRDPSLRATFAMPGTYTVLVTDGMGAEASCSVVVRKNLTTKPSSLEISFADTLAHMLSVVTKSFLGVAE